MAVWVVGFLRVCVFPYAKLVKKKPILDRLEVVTDNGDVDTLGQATP